MSTYAIIFNISLMRHPLGYNKIFLNFFVTLSSCFSVVFFDPVTRFPTLAHPFVVLSADTFFCLSIVALDFEFPYFS